MGWITEKISLKPEYKGKNRWLLLLYDLVMYAVPSVLLLFLYSGNEKTNYKASLFHCIIFGVLLFFGRILLGVYKQVWRYGGVRSYLTMIISDFLMFLLYYFVQLNFPFQRMSFVRILALACANLLISLSCRMLYRYAYEHSDSNSKLSRIICSIIRILGSDIHPSDSKSFKTNVAIVGAGRIGTALATELMVSDSVYKPVCFIDSDKEKRGRVVHGLHIYGESNGTLEILNKNRVNVVIFALPQLTTEKRKQLYEYYKQHGFKVKVYDSPTVNIAGKPKLREFDIEDLLFRETKVIMTEEMSGFYKDKTILITGGGGSIGSEMCRQVAKMSPKRIIILDIAENGAYDVQQYLKAKYGNGIEVYIEIASICDKTALRRVFKEHKPQIVIMAAAHKHVPLMEKNCIEAVKNNIFGTLNTIQVSEENDVERVIMVSTDKAVNPTNVMGATKRFCEMIALAYNAQGKNTTYSMTRFGNVLGSAGSVIPLFKNQIANGGPITITDKRIIRYFMSIPEAASLVLCSATLGEGSVYVLDMGKPVKIVDLAENMIRLSGAQGIEIVETGLRPGEKLYEELLVKSEGLCRTQNSMIFVEKGEAQTKEEIFAGLGILQQAIDTDDDNEVRAALKRVVPDFRSPEDVNEEANKKIMVMK